MSTFGISNFGSFGALTLGGASTFCCFASGGLVWGGAWGGVGAFGGVGGLLGSRSEMAALSSSTFFPGRATMSSTVLETSALVSSTFSVTAF